MTKPSGELSGEAFRRFLADDVLWRAHNPSPLWVDDEDVRIVLAGHPEQWLDPSAYGTVPDGATVRILSGHVASSQGYQGELLDLLATWQDQERRRLEALALHASVPDPLERPGSPSPTPRRRL